MRAARQLSILLAREIESLFLSPISYAVLTIVLLLNGYSFYLSLYDAQGNVGNTVRLFFGNTIMFWVVMLFVPPLFTMRLFAEERRSGTLEMLLTAPVGEVEVVLSKFFAGFGLFLSLWLPSLLYLAIVKSYGAIPEIGPLFTSYLGVGLLGSLFIAAGLFASSLTSNQIFAAVLATVFNLLLFSIPFLSQFIRVENVSQFLEEMWILNHFRDSFSKGLLDTGHVSFYVALVAMFLFWTVRSLESQRWR